MASHLPYALVDVFAERPFEGNQLAIFTDARGLTTAQMQTLARETNLSETTFILPADDAAIEQAQGVKVRIFTTEEELPFAGHPTLGTAAWLYWNHATLGGTPEIALDLPVGRIAVNFISPGRLQETPSGVVGTMLQPPPIFGDLHAPEAVAQTLGVALDDLDLTRPIQTVSTGMAFCIVPFRSVEALRRLASSPRIVQHYLDRSDAKFFYCLAPVVQTEDEQDQVDFRARMQFYQGEDPATGSAAGCAISYLVQHGFVASGVLTLFAQGVEMGRPSRLQVRASRSAGQVHDVRVGGRTISVGAGTFRVP